MKIEPIYANWPAPSMIKTLITTRQGGYSQKPYNNFNVATHVGDNPDAVQQNRELLNKFLPSEPIWLDQQHTNICLEVNRSSHQALSIADASLTTHENTVCAVLTADCMPLLICNKNATIVSAVHAGWKGMANGIIEKSIKKILEQTQETADQLMIWLGPAISQPSFEVGEDVRQQFIQKHPLSVEAFKPKTSTSNKYFCDLYRISHIILNQLGINQIYGDNYCTYKDEERFYSYRREGITGRIASMIWINNK